MPQTRFFLQAAPKTHAMQVFAAWDAAFGDEGAPVAVIELDEAADLHEVSVYFDDAGGEYGAAVAAALAGHPAADRIQREAIPDVDWVTRVLADLTPVRAGRFVVHGSHDRGAARAGEIAIEIEAGLAFGTGHHGTTAGCLATLDRLIRRRRPRRALDLGTGTAVLALAIAKQARVPVLATDIDPVAVAVARENVRANREAGRVRTTVATGLAGPAVRAAAPFDLVVANILAGPLMRLAPAVARHLAPGGDVVLSGILRRQRAPVLAAYRVQRLFHRATHVDGDWVTLHLSR